MRLEKVRLANMRLTVWLRSRCSRFTWEKHRKAQVYEETAAVNNPDCWAYAETQSMKYRWNKTPSFIKKTDLLNLSHRWELQQSTTAANKLAQDLENFMDNVFYILEIIGQSFDRGSSDSRLKPAKENAAFSCLSCVFPQTKWWQWRFASVCCLNFCCDLVWYQIK